MIGNNFQILNFIGDDVTSILEQDRMRGEYGKAWIISGLSHLFSRFIQYYDLKLAVYAFTI